MKRLFAFLSLVFLASPLAAAVSDYFDIGSVAAPWLREKAGARAAGFGGAFAARDQSLESVPFNPSGLAGLNGQSLSLAHHPFIEGSARSSVAWGMGFGNGSAAALSFNYHGFGQVDLVEINGSGQAASNGSLSPYGYFADATFAHGFAAGPRAGLTLRYVGEDLGNGAQGALTGDIGAGWTLPVGLGLGVAITNAFGELNGYRLPTAMAAGLAYQKDLATGQRVAAAVDLDLPFGDTGATHTSLGLEYGWRQYAARLGYRIAGRGGAGGISAGGGIAFGGATLDYAFQDGGLLGALHQVSVSYHFSGPDKASMDSPAQAAGSEFSDTDANTLYRLGLRAYKKKDYKAAASHLETLVNKRPNNSRAFTYLGLSYWRLGDKVRSRAMIEEASRLDPGNEKLKAWLKKYGK